MKEAERKNTVVLLYISYAFIILFYLFPLFSFIYLLIKRKDCKEDDVLASHIRWQLRTIVLAFIVNMPCIILYSILNTSFFALLDFMSFLPLIWVIYRVEKGIDTLSNNKST